MMCIQELEQIELVWMMTSEWEDHWNTWKSGRFIDVETGDMEDISTTLFRKLQKMSRELKVNSHVLPLPPRSCTVECSIFAW